MKYRILICLSLLTVQTVLGQNSGYFGKKNVVDFAVNLQNPSFSNLRIFANKENTLLDLEGDFLTSSTDRLDWGFRFNYSRTLKRNFAIGVEFGYDYFSAQRKFRQSQFSSDYYYFQKIDVNSMSIMPKIEFTTSGGLLPMGISHQIGFGVRIMKPVDKDYTVANANDYVFYGSDFLIPVDETLTKETNFVGDPVKGYTLMYAINLRSPLTKSLLLNYGIRYTLNFTGKPPYNFENTYVDDISDFNLTENEFKEIVRYRKQFSFIQAFIGLSFAF